MFNERKSVGCTTRTNRFYKTSLGNQTPRYNSEVIMQRRKFVLSSTRNSSDVPEWMSRTQSHHFREANRNRSMYSHAAAPFHNVQQTYVYARQPQVARPEGHFGSLNRHRMRSKWQMKNQTFQLEWPKPESQIRQEKTPILADTARPSSRPNQISKFVMSKYAYHNTPLHVQKDTPIKIGHPYLLDSTTVR